MVITRSQSSQNRQVETENMDRSSDNESEASFPELLSRDQMVDLDSDDVLTRRQNGNSYNIDQRFNEINRQIGDLTNIVLTLTNQFASVNGEGNRLNPATTSTDSRSDMVTGVSNPRPSGSRTTPPNVTPRSDESFPQIADVMTEIHHLRSTMGETLTHPKILQTQVPLFKGNRDKYNEFEHLLLNHLRPHAHKLTEEQKLNYFRSLLRDDVVEFWQTLTITTETTLRDILTAFKKEYAKEELSEVSKFKFDQLRYDPAPESFSTFLANYKKIAKQAYGEKTQEIVQTFLFAKLPIQLQNELAIAGKHNATIEDIKTFVQRRCQYAQLLPNQQLLQPFNQTIQTQEVPNKPVVQKRNENERPTIKKKFDGNCRYCASYGHKWAECRKRLRDEAAGNNNSQPQKKPEQQNNNAETQPKYNAKLVCQICGYRGHSAKDCRYRIPQTSAYGSVPYKRQTTNENRDFRRDFRRAHNYPYPANEMNELAPGDQQQQTSDDYYQQEFTEGSSSQPKNF